MRGIITLSMVALLALYGCGGDSGEGTSDLPVTQQEATVATQAAAQLVNDYSRSLKKELMAAMNEGGPPNAISVCQMKAPALTSDFHMDNVWSINRVSERNRNPENAADSSQRAILAKFADTSGATVEYLDMWTEEDGELVYHYYEPIRTMELCLNCHGDPANMSEEIREMLAKKYPDDKAVGYSSNELRGMFVVDVYWPEAKPHAEKLVAAH